MQQPGRIFLGATQNREFIRSVLAAVRPLCPRLAVPAVGVFGVVRAALEAGYAAENIETSDISIFSSVLGHLYSGAGMDAVGFRLSDDWAPEYERLEGEVERAAFLLWLIKVKQFKDTTYFDRQFIREFVERSERHRHHIAGKLSQYVKRYAGLRYRVADLRAVVAEANDAERMVVVNPPLYAKGYAKMFATAPDLVFESGVPDFDYKKEMKGLYEASKAKASPFLWTVHTDHIDLPARDCIFAAEWSKSTFSYFYTTRRETLESLGIKPRIAFRPRPKVLPNYKMVPHELAMSNDTRISFKAIDNQTALYYRDLFAHKLGTTNAELCVAMMLDGMVFGVVGFMLGAVQRGSDTYVMEVFGFNAPLERYPNVNRLLMMAITCEEMRDWLMTARKRNRLYEMRGLKTACLSKYRKVKLNNGLLRLVRREKWKRDLYKLLYVTDWHAGRFADVMKRYLDELATKTEVSNG